MPHHDGRITAGELTAVCAHYDLGIIRHVSRLKAGSRSAPKVVLISDKGAFLLKRRAPGHASNPRTVALTHEVMLHLEGCGLPAPELVGTRTGNNSMLQLASPAAPQPASQSPTAEPVPSLPTQQPGHLGPANQPSQPDRVAHRPSAPIRIYEVYRFIQGRPYDRSASDADAAGALLARMHRSLTDFTTRWPSPRGSYHNQPSIEAALRTLPDRVRNEASGNHPNTQPDPQPLTHLCARLADRYQRAAAAAESTGIGSAQFQFVHADWHPGNVLFRVTDSANLTESPQRSSINGRRPPPAPMADPAQRIAAILDFDSVRIAPLLTDLVNGAMQFALARSSPPQPPAASPSAPTNPKSGPTTPWRIGLDQNLLHAFYQGYRRESGRGLTPEECAAVPSLMIQALIVEATTPIVATGRFGTLDPEPLLELVDRATAQIESAEKSLVSLVSKP